MSRFSLGIDFGTLSGRCVLVNIETGEEVAAATKEYEHAVMTNTLPSGKKLPPDFALQHPADYLDVLFSVINECIKKANIDPKDIVGVGIDFTSSTVMPVDRDGTPLCLLDEFKDREHAYVKLWKHHSAQREADEITALLKETDPERLEGYGGTVSAEWQLPKILETLRQDEALYNRTYRFIEAGDFIVWTLTGKESHSICNAGFKALWNGSYPSKEFYKALDKRLENVVGDKLSSDIKKMSEVAGYITEDVAEKTGLKAGTPVAPAFIDAHAALPALGVTGEGELLMIIGTSSCHILLGGKGAYIPGTAGYVKDGIVDGLYAFEAGQSSVGDAFDWFVKNCVPHSYYVDAEKEGISIHKCLEEKAKLLKVGESSLIALDWFNGNRTPYVDSSLSGCIVGLTLSTKPEEIYRALIEATAFGTKRIIEMYEKGGISINKIYATGGIAEKNEMLMQIYSDVTGKEIFLSDTTNGCAYGSAVLGAVNEHGYKTLKEASAKMKKVKNFSYKPNKENTIKYYGLYEEYKALSEYFAKENNLMKKLKMGR